MSPSNFVAVNILRLDGTRAFINLVVPLCCFVDVRGSKFFKLHMRRRQAAARRGGSLFSDHVQTDQGTSFHSLRSNTGPDLHRLCDNEKLLVTEEEEEELAVWPILPWNIPDAGCRGQTHNIPRVQKPPDLGYPHNSSNRCQDPIKLKAKTELRTDETHFRTGNRITPPTARVEQSEWSRLKLPLQTSPGALRLTSLSTNNSAAAQSTR